MTRPELDRLLEQAVAEAIGVPCRSRPIEHADKARSAAGNRPLRSQQATHGLARELQHA